MKKRPVGTTIPVNEHEILKEICQARGLNPARDLHILYHEAVQLLIGGIDRKTGRPRPLTSWGIFFPSVCDDIERAVLEGDDAPLFAALDERPLMTWVAGTDRGCIFVSRELAKYTGKTIERLRGLDWLTELVSPADHVRLLKLTKDSYAAQQASQNNYRIRRDDGVYAWVVDHARPRFHPDGRFAGCVGTLYVTGTERESEAESFTRLFLQPGVGKSQAFANVLFANSMKLSTPIRRRRDNDFDVIIQAKHTED